MGTMRIQIRDEITDDVMLLEKGTDRIITLKYKTNRQRGNTLYINPNELLRAIYALSGK